MTIGASDMGTGCDTTLAQVAANILNCEMDDIVVYGVDTDISPYDSGSYASSTAYLTDAVVKTCETLKKKIIKKAAEYLSCGEDELEFTGKSVKRLTPCPKAQDLKMRFLFWISETELCALITRHFRQPNPVHLPYLRLRSWQVRQK